MYAYIHTCMYAYMYVYMYVCIPVCMHTAYMYVYIHVCIHVCMYACILPLWEEEPSHPPITVACKGKNGGISISLLLCSAA